MVTTEYFVFFAIREDYVLPRWSPFEMMVFPKGKRSQSMCAMARLRALTPNAAWQTIADFIGDGNAQLVKRSVMGNKEESLWHGSHLLPHKEIGPYADEIGTPVLR